MNSNTIQGGLSTVAATTMTSRQFNQDTARAKRLATHHPVFIKTRGEVSHVLLTKAEFDKLNADRSGTESKENRSLADVLAQVDGEDIEFDAPEFKGVGAGFEFE